MRVSDRFVVVLVFVPFGEVEPDAERHEDRAGTKARWRELPEEYN